MISGPPKVTYIGKIDMHMNVRFVVAVIFTLNFANGRYLLVEIDELEESNVMRALNNCKGASCDVNDESRFSRHVFVLMASFKYPGS